MKIKIFIIILFVSKIVFGQSTCQIVSKSPKGEWGQSTEAAPVFISEIVNHFQNNHYNKVYDKLDIRLQKNISQHKFIQTLKNKLIPFGKNPHIAALRVWKLNVTGGDPQAIYCKEDQLKIFPTYGFIEQYTLWMQVLGDKDLGRVFVQIVKNNDAKLVISNVTIHQWSHQGKDPVAWSQEANANLKSNLEIAAWLKLNLAKKFLQSNEYIHFDDTTYLQSEIAKIVKTHKPEAKIIKAAEDFELPKIDVALAGDGAALSIYIKFKTPKNRWDREKNCQNIGKNLKQAGLLTETSGLRCTFFYPNHDISIPSPLGEVFWTISKL